MADIKAETRRTRLAEPAGKAIMRGATIGGLEMNVRGSCVCRAARVLVAVGVLLGISLGAAPAEATGPGSILNVWPLEGGGPGNSQAFRILYRSTGLNGEPIEVSGAIYWNPGAAPAGGRNVVAWAHPTSGVVRACAPSLMPDNAGMIWGLADILAQSYVVMATDYPGLGTPGIHPYLIGVSEARAVLDSVRAARNLPHTGASDRFAVWGHSQGGHAALFTGQIAASYAPELKLVGVAAAAPATYLIELFDADAPTATGKELTAMALYSWTNLYKISAATLVEPAAMRPFERMAHDCIESVAEFKAISDAEKPLDHLKFLKVDPTETEPWRSLMQKNTPGQAPAGAPVFIAQGTADTTVHPEITKQFGRALCKQGARVTFVWLQGVSHTFAAKASASQTLRWIGDRFRGAKAPSSC